MAFAAMPRHSILVPSSVRDSPAGLWLLPFVGLVAMAVVLRSAMLLGLGKYESRCLLVLSLRLVGAVRNTSRKA